MSEIELRESVPSAEQYRALRRAVGWRDLAPADADVALRNSLFAVCALHGGNVVGCGRVIGDGGMYFYVQDVIVLPAFQRRGIGARIMAAIEAYMHSRVPATGFVGLMAARGSVPFYRSRGYVERPSDTPGMYCPKREA